MTENAASWIPEDPDDNYDTISDDEMTRRFIEAVRIDNEIKRAKGVPIAYYNAATQTAYLEYPDGHREITKIPRN